MWEESYGGHQDSKPHGPTAVAVDFTFAGDRLLLIIIATILLLLIITMILLLFYSSSSPP